MNRLLLVDGHAYAYRAFYAIGGLKGPDGRPTNAIFGFITMFDRARALANPTHLAVVWDGGLDVDRLKALPEYKGHRPEMPDDLEVQLDEIGQYLDAVGVLSVCQEGVEADDLIAAMAAEACRSEWRVVIATSDKDFMQLVGSRVQLLNPADKAQPLWGTDRVVEKTGVQPSQVVDWLSLVGDSVDNIEGVPGVGPKTAAKLLKQFGSVDAIYRELDTVQPERLRTALRGAKAAVLRNKALVQLNECAGSAPSLSRCMPRAGHQDRLKQLFENWGFRSLAKTYGMQESEQQMLL